MTDKLSWRNQHKLLKIHNTVDDVVKIEKYELPSEIKSLSIQTPEAEFFTAKLLEQKRYGECLKFLSYNLHKRALAWWAYCCVLNLCHELKKNPKKPLDLDDLAKPKPLTPPEWAKMPEMPQIKDVNDVYNDPEIKKAVDVLNRAKEKLEAEIKTYPQEWIDEYNSIKDEVYAEFAKTYGKDPDGMIQDFVKIANDNLNKPAIDEEKSPIFKASADLKEKIEANRLKTIKDIKKALPPKDLEKELKRKADALDAAYAYIAIPNDATAKRCLEAGNACPDTPEGMMSLVCFWSYGNMMPNPENEPNLPVVPTPHGLAANGFNSLILMCCLAEGGDKDFERREYTYLTIGLEIMYGKNNWSEFLTSNVYPHENIEGGSFNGALEPEELAVQLKELFGSETDPSSKDEISDETKVSEPRSKAPSHNFRINRFR